MSPISASVKASRPQVPSFLRRPRATAQAPTPSNAGKTRKAPALADVDCTGGSQRTDRVFEAVRHRAYAVARERNLCGSGDDGKRKLQPIILDMVAAESERGGDGLAHHEISSTTWSIARFCAHDLRPRPWAPRDAAAAARRRSHREAVRRTASVFLDWHPKAKVAFVARQTDRAAATVHRDLLATGHAPRREAIIRGLPRAARRIVRHLDAALPGYGRRTLLDLDELAAKAFPAEARCRTAPIMRRNRTKEALALIASSRLGLHPHVVNGKVAVSRGLRWHSFKDIATYAATARLRSVPALARPKHVPVAQEAAEDLEAILKIMAWTPGFEQTGDAVWRLGHRCASVLDARPLRHLVRTVVIRADVEDMGEALAMAQRRAEAQGDPIDTSDLQDFIWACSHAKHDARSNWSIGWAVDAFLNNSGYARRAGDSSRGRKLLATLRGMAWALKRLDDEVAAFEYAAAWKARPETAPIPLREGQDRVQVSPFEGEVDEGQALEVMGKYAVEEGSPSQSRYQLENLPPPRPKRPPRRGFVRRE